MPLAFTGIFRNNQEYSGITWHFRKNNSLTELYIFGKIIQNLIKLKKNTSIMFDAPFTIQHTYVQLGIV